MLLYDLSCKLASYTVQRQILTMEEFTQTFFQQHTTYNSQEEEELIVQNRLQVDVC